MASGPTIVLRTRFLLERTNIVLLHTRIQNNSFVCYEEIKSFLVYIGTMYCTSMIYRITIVLVIRTNS